MQRTPLVTDNFYHVYNRGVEKRDIFLDERDYYQFVHCLYEFNDQRPTIDTRWQSQRTVLRESRAPIVDIISWCLMPNHFHLLLRQRVDGGVTLFMKKLGTGHAMYFNKKNQRNGILFQGRFKSVHIDRDAYLLHLILYIHLNPVDLIEPEWKEKGVQNWEQVIQFLEQYRWSSYRDWSGNKNFPSLLSMAGMHQLFANGDDHKRFIREWLSRHHNEISHLLFE